MNLVTWNTQWCCGVDGVVSPERIVRTARELADFDVLCLQEIAVNYPRLKGDASHDQPAIIRSLLPGFDVFFGAAVDEFNADGTRSQFGNLVATRLPVLHVQHHPLTYPPDNDVPSMPRMCTVVTVLDPDLGPVRAMTTHLEYYSKKQRMAQVKALRELHGQYCAHAAMPPAPSDDGSPFRTKVHTVNAILCGDFNFQPDHPEHAEIGREGAFGRLWDCWPVVHGKAPHAHTYLLYDKEYGADPMTCDFIWANDGLKQRIRRMEVDSRTQASDHQPMLIHLAGQGL